MTQAPTKPEPFEEFIKQYKTFRTLAGKPAPMNPFHRALHDPMWYVLPVLKLPIYLWFFTYGQVDLPILQDPFTQIVLFVAIAFFHALWFALYFAGIAWEWRAGR
jgi:hypothetical protein